MSLSIFTTLTDPEKRGDAWKPALACYKELADEVVVCVGGPSYADSPVSSGGNLQAYYHGWPKEFEWKLIGQKFQQGYEHCTGDWVLRMDLDMIIHEKDYSTLYQALHKHDTNPGLRFWKYQFFTPDRYNIKSHLVLAVNKKMYGDRIRFDGGGDLCQPTLDGKYIEPRKAPEVKVPVWNYDCILKTREQIREDKGRFARAWFREFGEYKLGGPDEDSAYNKWWEMIKGRYKNHTGTIAPDHHPSVMQETIKNLRPDQFGHNGFGLKSA